MRIWRLGNPFDYRFAQTSLRGKWAPVDGGGLCPKCTAANSKRVEPLIFEWGPGSVVVGDFVWPGLNMLAVKEGVISEIQQHFSGIRPGPVQMIQDPKLRKSTRITSRTKPRIWLPYEGPPLQEVWVDSIIPINADRSTVHLVRECNVCGRKQYEITGIEERENKWDPDRKESITTIVPRVNGQGLFIDHADLKEAGIFRVAELPAWIICTDRVKEFIEHQHYTNITFFELGDVV